MSHSDTRCARTAGPATTPPVLVGRTESRAEQRAAASTDKYCCQIPAAQHSVEEVPAVTPLPTAEVSNTRRSVPVLQAPLENPGQEGPVRGLPRDQAPGLELASELRAQGQAQCHPALCVTQTRVGERRSAMKVWTGLVTRDQSVPVRKFSHSSPPQANVSTKYLRVQARIPRQRPGGLQERRMFQ